MGEYQFKALKHRSQEIKEPEPGRDTLKTLQSDLTVKGEFIGCFWKKNMGKKIEVKLEMETDARPVAQKPHPVPYHLQRPLKDWLDQGVKEEIFEKVSDGEAITWCSPLMVQSKPKFTKMKSEELESHLIIASIDMRFPNQSMKQSQCIQSARVEDFICFLHNCKILTTLDLRQDNHQLALDTSTKQVATFSTP